eukprot:247761-Amphidinium_carterae.1
MDRTLVTGRHPIECALSKQTSEAKGSEAACPLAEKGFLQVEGHYRLRGVGFGPFKQIQAMATLDHLPENMAWGRIPSKGPSSERKLRQRRQTQRTANTTSAQKHTLRGSAA